MTGQTVVTIPHELTFTLPVSIPVKIRRAIMGGVFGEEEICIDVETLATIYHEVKETRIDSGEPMQVEVETDSHQLAWDEAVKACNEAKDPAHRVYAIEAIHWAIFEAHQAWQKSEMEQEAIDHFKMMD